MSKTSIQDHAMEIRFVLISLGLLLISDGNLLAIQATAVTSPERVFVQYFRPAACNGKLVFAGEDKDRGSEPWVTDGTPAGTMRLKDIWPGPKPSSPFGFTAFQDRVVFWAEDFDHGRELWITDGTEAGTTLLKDICPGKKFGSVMGPDPINQRQDLTAEFNKMLYFFAHREGGWPSALYRTDGTEAGTVSLISVNSGCGELIVGQDCVYVFNFGDSIWKSDGTPQGTVQVSKIKKWDLDSSGEFNSPDRQISWRPACLGPSVFFAAHDKNNGIELWKTDGTEAGTGMVRDIRKGFGPGYGESDRSSYPQWLTAFKNEVYFTATDEVDPDRGRELWKSDGTSAGTVMVKDINPGRGSSKPAQLIVWNNALYFTAVSDPNDKYGRRTLWKTDGTEKGTVQVRGVSYVPNSPGWGTSGWPMAWPTTFRNSLFLANDAQASLVVARMRQGSNQIEMLWWGGRDSNGYQNPLWISMNDNMYFVAEGKLWRAAASPELQNKVNRNK
jgi:ELWxxDGT repeat protein